MTKNDGRGRGAKNRQIKRERIATWTLALREGRVLRVNLQMTAYPTLVARDRAIADLQAGENEIEIIEENEAGQVRYGTVESDGNVNWRVVREPANKESK